MSSEELKQKLAFLSQDQHISTVCGLVRGIERETLRVNPDGSLSQKPHPEVFGSALKHPYITTDYSEALMEFITPASVCVDTTINQLTDIHAHVAKNLGDEFLWPMSMPCYISDEDAIQLANYGQSNVGQMKHLYRRGLKYRYGSFMQVISGIHFNLSFPDDLWQSLSQYYGDTGSEQDFKSAQYLHLIRNFKRYAWLLTYLYGASPALCGSFIGERAAKYPFETVGNGGLYLPYATSLRLSDLGYTSNAQSDLNISYSSLDEYVAGLRKAIQTPIAEYEIKQPNEAGHAQLNNNLLQIENEYYSPVRPKRGTRSGEKPTDALDERGIEYVEIRSMDVNPFSPVGIDKSQIYFLDVFLAYCLLEHSPVISDEETQRISQNFNDVVLRGRDPELKLNRGDETLSVQQWGEQLMADLAVVAKWLDDASGKSKECGEQQVYQQIVAEQLKAVRDPSLTLSAKFLAELKASDVGSGTWAKEKALAYKQMLLAHEEKLFNRDIMAEAAQTSVAEQLAVEQSDDIDFETFLAQYFAA